jgi:anti-anti-sigma factor
VLDEGLSIEVAHVDGSVVVRVSGEIDLVSAPTLEAALSDLGDGLHIVIDCAGVQFMDSTGLNLFVTEARRLSASGGSLHLRNTSFPVRHIVEITGLIQLLERDEA